MIRRRTIAPSGSEQKELKRKKHHRDLLKKKLVLNKEKKKITLKNATYNGIRPFNTGADLSLTHIYSLKKSLVNDILTNNIYDINIDIFYIYAKLLDFDMPVFEYGLNSKISSRSTTRSSSKSSSGQHNPKKRTKFGGALNAYIEGFLENQYIFDNKHDFAKLLKQDYKKYLYKADDIKTVDDTVKKNLQVLFSKDERIVFFELLQTNIEIVQKLLYVSIDNIKDNITQSQITTYSTQIDNKSIMIANIINFFEITLYITNAKYITDGVLNVKKDDDNPNSVLFNTIASATNKYLIDNSINTLENCFDSLSVSHDKIYTKFKDPVFIQSIEQYALISSLIFNYDTNLTPPISNISKFKAFRPDTSLLFDVVYYKTLDRQPAYKTALVFKDRQIISDIIRSFQKTRKVKDVIIYLNKIPSSLVFNQISKEPQNPNEYYAMDLKIISNFNSPGNISAFINNNFQANVDNKSIIYQYVLLNKQQTPSITPEEVNKQTAYILFDLKKAGDVCKILFAFYYNYIKNGINPALVGDIGFSSNDKFAALTSIVKETNNVFFCDKTTNTIYIYNNSKKFNMKILNLWFTKYLCLDKYGVQIDLFKKINDNIDVYNSYFSLFSDENATKQITSKINTIVHQLHETDKLDTIDLLLLAPTDKNEYNIYIRVLLLIYLNGISEIIKENFRSNIRVFTLILFKQTNANLELITTKLLEQIDRIFSSIINKIKDYLIRSVGSFDITDPNNLHLILNIINNILTIVHVFLYIQNSKIIVIEKINGIKKHISELIAKKYTKSSSKSIEQQAMSHITWTEKIYSSLKSTIFNKISIFITTPDKKRKSKQVADNIIDNIAINQREIDGFISNFVIKLDIINFIMIFNEYYQYFDTIIGLILTSGIDIQGEMTQFINKIKLIYFYIYIQLYTNSNIDGQLELRNYYEQILLDIINTNLVNPIKETIDNFLHGLAPSGVLQLTQEQKDNHLKLMRQLQADFDEKFTTKISFLKDNIRTLNIINYKPSYNFNILSELIFTEHITTIDTPEFIDKFTANNIIIDITEQNPIKKKLINIYNLLLFDNDPILPQTANASVSSQEDVYQQKMGGSIKKILKSYK